MNLESNQARCNHRGDCPQCDYIEIQRTTEEMIEDLIESPRFDMFSKWEQGFLDSINEQNYPLTTNQIKKLFDIYEKYFG